jgi:5-methyltetrahydrofolate--homocysteine methyltransferase
VGLLVGDGGLPKTVQDRLDNASFLMEKFLETGLSEEDVFLDPCVIPVSTDSEAGPMFLASLRELAGRWPSTHRIAAISNVSFGLPARAHLNRCFLDLAMGSGLDSVILNPMDPSIRQTLMASQTLLGRDSYCRKYLQAFRQGLLD